MEELKESLNEFEEGYFLEKPDERELKAREEEKKRREEELEKVKQAMEKRE